ncbi:MAG: type III secretion system chaperone [Acetobacteraceae bacterium]
MRGLLRDFGAGIGLPQLSPDEQGYCCLRIGEEITISLQYEPEAQNLVLFARLCQIDETASEAANEMMLAGNMFWGQTRGATLAVEPVERIVFLLAKEAVVSLDLPNSPGCWKVSSKPASHGVAG